MRARVLGVVAAALLAWPATAAAGGFATVGVSPDPAGTRAGEAWDVELEVLQHGRTPMTFGDPPVVLVARAGAGERPVRATPTERPGIYRARVVFASAGRWSYAVQDPFGARHDFAPVQVAAAPAPAASPEAGVAWGPPAAALAAGLAAGLLALALQRRRTPPALRA